MKLRTLTALDVKAVAFRRIIGSVSAARKKINSPRLLEAYWILLESQVAAQQKEFVTQKQLVAASDGVFSAPTISRAVRDLVQQGLLHLVDNPRDGRSGLLLPTREAAELLDHRAEATVALMRALIATMDDDGRGDMCRQAADVLSSASDSCPTAAPRRHRGTGAD